MDRVHYYIVNVSTPKPLVVDTHGKQNGVRSLVLKAKNKDSTQLWKWELDATISNKQDTHVMDVKRSIRKAGKIVILDSKKKNVNQGWHLINDHLISNRQNLALDITGEEVQTDVHLCVKDISSDTPSQKWKLVPEGTWEEFQRGYKDGNPLKILLWHHHVATNYIHVIIGCTLDDYKNHVEKCASTIKRCAYKLDAVTTDTGITKTVGGSAAVLGGIAMVIGLALAPVSAGTSLLLSVGGSVTSVLGGTTALTANIIDQVWEKKKREEMKQAITPAITASLNFENFINSHNESMESAITFLKTPQGIKLVLKMIKDYKNIATTAGTAYNTFNTVVNTIVHVKKFISIPQFLRSVEGINRLVRVSEATKAAAPGVHFFSKCIVATGSTAAKGITGSVAVVGIAFGLWDICSGAKQIVSKSDLAKEFRLAAENIKDKAGDNMKTYNLIIEESKQDTADIDGNSYA